LCILYSNGTRKANIFCCFQPFQNGLQNVSFGDIL
jgi:hypothetical protein